MKGGCNVKRKYDDIINHEYTGVKKHKKMTLSNRAAQFAPFVALTGYDSAINETARLTDERITLSVEMKEKLDWKLNILKEYMDTSPNVKITYFIKDEKKSGGTYKVITGTVIKIDKYIQTIIMEDKTVVYIKDIFEIESDLFSEMGY
jgi:hypothetical protein